MQRSIKTPVWTGDIDRNSDSLKTTGLMGSLRWWTEAVIRGMGKFACDPVADSCPKPDSSKKISYYCPACLLFGATGRRRMFKLQVNGGTSVFSGDAIKIKPNGRNNGWFLGSGLTGTLNLEFISLSKDFNENMLLVPLAIAVKWGGIGAKTQHGYGVVEFDADFEKLKEGLATLIKLEGETGTNISLPNIKEMFFAKVQFQVTNSNWWLSVDGLDNTKNKWVKSGSVPIAPAVKNWMRFGKEITTRDGKKLQVSPYNEVNKEISLWLFGNPYENSKTSSKINISCAYKINNSNLWEFRIWGWLPTKDLPHGFKREEFLNSLKGSLEGNNSITIPWSTTILGSKVENVKLKVWREFNSARDTVKNESDIDSYLKSLLQGEEGKE